MTQLRIGYGNLEGTPDWTSVVDLLDRSRLYHEPGSGGGSSSDSPNVQRDVSATCGTACTPDGTTAVLKKSRLLYWTRTYTLFFKSADYQTAKENRDKLRNIIDVGRAYQQKLGCDALGLPFGGVGAPVYLIRRVGNETYPSVWTVLDGTCIPIDEQFSSLWIIGMRLELLIMEGAPFVNADGYPIAGVAGASVPV